MRIPTNFLSRTYYSDGNENTKSIFDVLVIRKTYPLLILVDSDISPPSIVKLIIQI